MAQGTPRLNAERCEYGSWGLDRCPRPGTRLAEHPNPVIGELLVCSHHDDELRRRRAVLAQHQAALTAERME